MKESVSHKCLEIREDAQYQHLLNFHDEIKTDLEKYVYIDSSSSTNCSNSMTMTVYSERLLLNLN